MTEFFFEFFVKRGRSEKRTQPAFEDPVSSSHPLQSGLVKEEAVRRAKPGVKDEFVDPDKVPRWKFTEIGKTSVQSFLPARHGVPFPPLFFL